MCRKERLKLVFESQNSEEEKKINKNQFFFFFLFKVGLFYLLKTSSHENSKERLCLISMLCTVAKCD